MPKERRSSLGPLPPPPLPAFDTSELSCSVPPGRAASEPPCSAPAVPNRSLCVRHLVPPLAVSLRRTSAAPCPLQPLTNALSHRLKKSDLLGTPYIPTSFQPSVFLQLDFPSGASVQLGNHVLPSEGVEEPIISFLAADPTSTGESYALLSFDPDAPSRENQEFGPWRHWIVGGLKPVSVDSIAQGSEKPLVEKSEEALTPWTGPSPGKATG